MNEDIEQIASSDLVARLRQICSPHKGRIHLRRPVNPLFAFPCSCVADHTFGMFRTVSTALSDPCRQDSYLHDLA